MALPFLQTWQSLADFKYPECAVEYQPPKINVRPQWNTSPTAQNISSHKFQKEILLAMDSAALNTQWAL